MWGVLLRAPDFAGFHPQNPPHPSYIVAPLISRFAMPVSASYRIFRFDYNSPVPRRIQRCSWAAFGMKRAQVFA